MTIFTAILQTGLSEEDVFAWDQDQADENDGDGFENGDVGVDVVCKRVTVATPGYDELVFELDEEGVLKVSLDNVSNIEGVASARGAEVEAFVRGLRWTSDEGCTEVTSGLDSDDAGSAFLDDADWGETITSFRPDCGVQDLFENEETVRGETIHPTCPDCCSDDDAVVDGFDADDDGDDDADDKEDGHLWVWDPMAYGSGAGVRSHATCRRCGLQKTEDSGASDHCGQRMTKVSYQDENGCDIDQ